MVGLAGCSLTCERSRHFCSTIGMALGESAITSTTEDFISLRRQSRCSRYCHISVLWIVEVSVRFFRVDLFYRIGHYFRESLCCPEVRSGRLGSRSQCEKRHTSNRGHGKDCQPLVRLLITSSSKRP